MTARGVPGPVRSDLGFPLMSSAAFSYAPLLPTGPDQTEYRLITDEGVDVVDGPGGRRFLTVDPAALTALTAEAMHDIAHYLRPAHLAQLRSIIDDPAASPERPVRGAGPAAQRQHRRRRRAADVPGHRHRDRDGQAGPARAHRRHRRRGDLARRLPGVHQAQPALLAARPADHVGRAQHRHQPAGPGRDLRRGPGRARRRVQVPLHGQGRRLGQQVVPLPGDQGAAEPDADDAVPGGEAAADRHRGLPAVPPGDRHRRHLRRVRAEDRQVRLRQVPRHPAHLGIDDRRTASATWSWRPRCWS